MLEKLQAIARRLDQVERQLSDPAIYADREMLTRLSREQKELTPIAAAFRAWQQAEDDCAQAQELLTDPEMRELAQEELRRARQERDRLSQELKTLLLPRDPNDDRNVILEVRAGIGGEEGALFAADLLRMYALYSERRGWHMEPVYENTTELGGVKEASFSITGDTEEEPATVTLPLAWPPANAGAASSTVMYPSSLTICCPSALRI